MVYLGAGVLCKNREHISITILEDIFKNKGIKEKIYKLIIALFSIGFLIIVAKIGFAVLSIVSSQTSANMQMTMNLIYMMIPIGSCIMIFYLLVEILQLFIVQKSDDSVKAETINKEIKK